MSQQVLRKWGNSPALRIPVAVMEAAHLAVDQTVEIKVEAGRLIIEPIAPTYRLDALLAGITEENRHEAVEFGAPQGREQL